jgi:HEAT repeat protein
MCRTDWLSLAACWMLVLIPHHGYAAEPEGYDPTEDEKLLKGAGGTPTGPGLLDFFRKRIPDAEAGKRAEDLVAKLGSRTFRERERAAKGLLELGLAARPALKEALTHKDLEVRRRAEACLTTIEQASTPEVEAAAVRLLRARAPDGACAVLLNFLPSARDATVEEECLAALTTLGVKSGKIDEALVKALGEREPLRRAAAALVLGHAGSAAQRDRVHALLGTETDPRVKLRAAQGLLAGRDKRAVPVLLSLLTEAPAGVAQEAHLSLSGLAGEKSPPESLDGGAEARKQGRVAWETWWKANQKTLDLAKADIGLPWLNTTARIRAAVRLFAEGLTKRKPDILRKCTDVPFNIGGFITMNTRQELDNLFGQAITQPEQKVEFSTPRVGKLDDYLKSAPPPLRDFLGKYPIRQLHAVYLSGKQNGREETAILFVRVWAGQVKIIGLGDAKSSPK